MQSIRQIQELNKRELEAGISPDASWHTDYRDTAYIYIGGLPFELSEGDILTIFSQFGCPTYINLIRDKETGKSKGFAFLKYEDQRSTDLAVDNLGGAVVMGRTLKVDHTRYKKKNEDEPDEGIDLTAENRYAAPESDVEEDDEMRNRPLLKEERELAAIIRDHDEEDPMKAFLIDEKKAEVSKALARLKDGKDDDSHTSRHRHHRSHRHREDDSDRHQRHRSSRGVEKESRHHRDSRDNRERSGRYEDDQNPRSTYLKSRHDRSDDDNDGEIHHQSRRNRDNYRERKRSLSRENDRNHRDRSEERKKIDDHSDRDRRRKGR